MSGSTSTARETADRSWKSWTLVGVVAIWLSVAAISLFSPDLVSGSEQGHLPIAAFTTWLFGAAGTAAVLLTMWKLRGAARRKPIWTGFTVVVAVIWLVATVLALTLPELETGTDPTKVPLGAIFAPLAASVLTALAGVVAVVFGHGPPETAAG